MSSLENAFLDELRKIDEEDGESREAYILKAFVNLFRYMEERNKESVNAQILEKLKVLERNMFIPTNM